MNSIVQCLNVSLPFSDEVMRIPPPVSGGISVGLSSVFRGIRGVDDAQDRSTVYNPKPLREQIVSRFPWFRGKDQHDAHEFLRTLLGSVSDEFEQAERRAKAAGAPEEERVAVEDRVARYFSGRLCAATLCWGCSRVSCRLDPFLDVPLHLPALAGQQVGAMGVTAAMASGESDQPPDADADGAGSGGEPDGSSDDGSARRKKKKSRKGKESSAAASSSSAAAGPKAGKPLIGVWAAAKNTEELQENTRVYVGRLVARLLQKLDPPEEEPEEEEETFEIELTRQSKSSHPQWGFKWSDTKCEESQLVLCSIAEDSILEKWNLKRRAMGDVELAVCVGDRLVEVNGEAEYKAMSKALRTEDKVSLTFSRGGSAKQGDLGRARAESDGEEERKAQAAAAKEALRRDFLEAAQGCHKALPPVLADIFGATAPSGEGGPGPVSEQIPLERCMRHFSGVEAVEDDYKPTYACPACAKERGGKQFASRRMWLWASGLPPLLTLQLKRFRRYRDRFEKSHASIGLPLELDLSDYVLSPSQFESLRPHVDRGLEDVGGSPETQANGSNGSATSLRYELYAICVHLGQMKSGHYIAYVNSGPSLESEKWFKISDAKCQSCDRAEVLKAEAYLAFYRREGTGAAAAAAAAAAANATGATPQAAGEPEEDAAEEAGSDGD